MADVQKILTPPFRMSYPHLFTPYSMDNKDPKYQLTMMFPKGADISKLKTAVANVVKTKWGEKPKGCKSPFLDGDDREDKNFHGTIFVRTASRYQPGVIDGSKVEVLSEKAVLPGHWARATVNPYAWDFKGRKGVSFGLQNVQILPVSFVIDFYKGEQLEYEIVDDPFVSYANASADFDEVDAEADNPGNYEKDDSDESWM